MYKTPTHDKIMEYMLGIRGLAMELDCTQLHELKMIEEDAPMTSMSAGTVVKTSVCLVARIAPLSGTVLLYIVLAYLSLS
jgi:hypothetical protein